MLSGLTLILGGVASGKSAFAESLMNNRLRDPIYLATAQTLDEEMSAKVAAHRARRGLGWRTIEEPLDLPRVITDLSPDDTVLLDCATLWLSNVMMAEREIALECSALVEALNAAPCPIIVVSNEVGLGGIADNRLARRFASAQGRLNQQIAAVADRAALVVAGLPLVLKGSFAP